MATVLLVLIYVAFISLGLPDALLGAAWPAMRPGFAVPVSFAGILQVIIAGGTIVSSMNSGRVLRRFGTGKVTAFSVGLTAIALLGFGLLPSFWWLIAAAIPLGLGAGSVDAGLNAFVAEHYESRHMSWLHSFWGVGALSGPLLLALLLRNNYSWRTGYLSIGVFQWVLVVVLIVSIPLWKKVAARSGVAPVDSSVEHPSLAQVVSMRGVPFALVTFLFYCGIEASMGLWGGTYLVAVKGFEPAAAASWVSAFFASITAGRFLTGFATFKISNNNLIRGGAIIIIAGVILMLAPLPVAATLAGFLLVGFGCAPIFPCMLHETPVRFGSTHAQSVMGVQMAFAYIGTTFLPPLFGFVSSVTSLALLPVFLLGYIAVLFVSSERLRTIRAGS
ncbi:MAG: MFS transporter [Treponema sp.]|jgi:fucose permease|nr:MFS transporter [Treponema sp.]